MQTFPHKPLNPFVNFDLHRGIFVTGPIPLPGWAFHLGAGMLLFAEAGGKNANNKGTVFADGQQVLSGGHEVKYLVVPHWNMIPFTPAQPNLFMPLLIAGSSSKCQMSASSVEGTDGPLAVSVFRFVGINQACADPVPMPTSLTLNWGTVHVGFGLADLLGSIGRYLFDVAVGYLIAKTVGGAIKGVRKIPGLSKVRGLPKNGMMKVLRKAKGWPLLRRSNIMISRDSATGRFASMSDGLVNETLMTVGKDVSGRGVEASNVPKAVEAYIQGASESLVGP